MIKKTALFLSLLTSLHSLEINFSIAKESNIDYSIMKLSENEKFFCTEIVDDFKTVTEIICAFKKRPVSDFNNVSNEFFNVFTKIKDKKYFIVIRPKEKMKLYPIDVDLRDNDVIFEADISKSKKWLIVGYKNKLPFFKKDSKSDNFINFPIYTKEKPLPSVGGLDLKGNPIFMQSVEDVNEYMKIKQNFSQGNYELVLSLIDEVITEYPDSIFMSEVIYYKIHALHEVADYESVIEISKHFLRQFSSDEHIAEVLLDIAHAYSKIGLFIDADYFFDRLFNEHKGSDSAYQGMIYKGDQYISSGDNNKAKKYLREALYNTTNVEIASEAAFKLAKLDMEKMHYSKAELMLNKIYDGNDKYFYNHYHEAMKVLQYFEENNQFEYAAKMAEYLLMYMKKSNEDYEKLLRDYGTFLAKSEGKEAKAIDVLNRYLKEFPYGQFSDDIQRKKDGLFFEARDENLSVRLANYDKLMQEYKNDTIADHALYKKVDLLYKNSFYQDVLDMQTQIETLDPGLFPDVINFVPNSAKKLMQEALKKNRCLRVVELSDAYGVKLSSKWDDGIYKCSMTAGNYMLAEETIKPYIKAKEIDSRLKWQFRYAKLLLKTARYKESIKVAKDVISLIDLTKSSDYNEIYRVLFDDYSRTSNNAMIEAIIDIEKKFGLDFKDLERYTQMLALATKLQDNNMIETYAKKVITLQKRSNTYTQSPYVEFTLSLTYQEQKRYKEAIEVLKGLDDVKISSEKRSRQKYLLASLYQKLGKLKEAKNYFRESIDSNSTSAWSKLSQDALELLK